MKVLVVGSGGREHALAWKLSASPSVSEVLVAPGNGGTAQLARNVPLLAEDIDGLLSLARQENVGLTVVGPEVPLANGIADAFTQQGLRIFAPSRRAARLEASKVWAKAFLARHEIPTAPFYVSSRFDDAVALVRMMPTPVVVKASGLAAGKGVTVAASVREAEEILRRMMVDRSLNGAGDEVVLESFLEGREVSLLAFVDGKTAVPMPLACDYKTLEDGNRGPNTGGMGAYSPPSWLSASMQDDIMQRIFWPTIEALRAEDLDFRGVLYFGLMVTSEGPWVLEFNVRFGDPEAQVILPRLQSDLLEVLLATAEGRLGEQKLQWSDAPTCGVVLAARGYPGVSVKGQAFPEFDANAGIHVFHAATARHEDGTWTASGGRLATLVATGADLSAARERVYQFMSAYDLSAFHYRRDIAKPFAAASL